MATLTGLLAGREKMTAAAFGGPICAGCSGCSAWAGPRGTIVVACVVLLCSLLNSRM